MNFVCFRERPKYKNMHYHFYVNDLFLGFNSNATNDLMSPQKKSKSSTFSRKYSISMSEGNLVCKFPYFRKYSEIKLHFYSYVIIFSKLQISQVIYLPE